MAAYIEQGARCEIKLYLLIVRALSGSTLRGEYPCVSFPRVSERSRRAEDFHVLLITGMRTVRKII